MSSAAPFDPWGRTSPASLPEAGRHSCGPPGPPCQQMVPVGPHIPFSTVGAAGSGSAGQYGGLGLYERQLSEGAAADAGRPQQASFGCLQQRTYEERPEAPAGAPRFPPQTRPSCTSSGPPGQVLNRQHPDHDQSAGAKYLQIRQDGTAQTLFPKPIYSYSTLIFMALMNSKSGCLPVSEIYSFMMEHFPYFKTAPDGWKNSVRHNLSLNKCFVKMENKSGNLSRKGCLWSLNPAKVDKMREELHKWRRKDPVTVRRSMARPECLDRLLGERPTRFRHSSGTALLPRVATGFNATAPSRPAAPPRLSGTSSPCAAYAHVRPRQCCYPAPALAHIGSTFALHTSASGGLSSPPVGMVPPVDSCSLQAQYGVSSRSIQDFVTEGFTDYDVDALNPSLTDLQLQGNVWEELQEDCLASDPHVASDPLDHNVTPSCSQAAASVCQAMCEDQNGASAEHLEHHSSLSGPPPPAYSGVEILAGYVTTCSTAVSLM